MFTGIIFLSSLVSSCLSLDFGFEFVKWPAWELVAPGDLVMLECETNMDADKIHWQHRHSLVQSKNGSVLDKYRKVNFSVENQGNKRSLLMFRVGKDVHVYKHQEGTFQCVASLGSISISSVPGKIQVAFQDSFIHKSGPPFTIVDLVLGQPLRVGCDTPMSLPESSVTYYKDGRELVNVLSKDDFLITSSGDLVLFKPDDGSLGVYTCAVRNSVFNSTLFSPIHTHVVRDQSLDAINSEFSNDTDSLNKFGKDGTVEGFQSSKIAERGDSVRLVCLSTVINQLNFEWSFKASDKSAFESLTFRDSKALNNSYSISRDTTFLDLHNVDLSASGTYRCRPTLVAAKSVEFSLNVKGPPSINLFLKSHSVQEKEKVELECITESLFETTQDWIFNGRLVDEERNFVIRDNRLIIPHIVTSQAGAYQCIAMNSYGAVQKTAVITVIPKTIMLKGDSSSSEKNPFMVRNRTKKVGMRRKTRKKGRRKKLREKLLKYTKAFSSISSLKPNVTKLSDESVLISWDSKIDDQMPISFFKVQFRQVSGIRAGEKHWHTLDVEILPPMTSFEVSGLKTGKSYRFRVAAVYLNNDHQFGPSSKRFHLTASTKLRPPSPPPKIIEILPITNGIQITWETSAFPPVEGYVIYYRDTETAMEYRKMVLLGEERRDFDLVVNPNVSYEFKMSVFNMAGQSEFSRKIVYIPKNYQLSLPETTVVVPVVVDSSETWVNYYMAITLSVGVTALILIILGSLAVYAVRNKNQQGHEAVPSKYLDTSFKRNYDPRDTLDPRDCLTDSCYKPMLQITPSNSICSQSLNTPSSAKGSLRRSNEDVRHHIKRSDSTHSTASRRMENTFGYNSLLKSALNSDKKAIPILEEPGEEYGPFGHPYPSYQYYKNYLERQQRRKQLYENQENDRIDVVDDEIIIDANNENDSRNQCLIGARDERIDINDESIINTNDESIINAHGENIINANDENIINAHSESISDNHDERIMNTNDVHAESIINTNDTLDESIIDTHDESINNAGREEGNVGLPQHDLSSPISNLNLLGMTNQQSENFRKSFTSPNESSDLSCNTDTFLRRMSTPDVENTPL